MEQAKAISLKNEKILYAIKFSVILALAIFAPMIKDQMITGTIVNALLFSSVFLLDFKGALAIALFPSLVSLSTGLLPGAMVPMVPFIVLGNIILISVFSLLKGKNYGLAAISASALKFVWLFSVSQLVMGLFVKESMATNIAAMMGLPQLFTALAGAVLAYIFVAKDQKIKN
ncbi:MAG: iron hydrogenase [Candidatus Paceibacterota bacterium]